MKPKGRYHYTIMGIVFSVSMLFTYLLLIIIPYFYYIYRDCGFEKAFIRTSKCMDPNHPFFIIIVLLTIIIPVFGGYIIDARKNRKHTSSPYYK